MCMDLADITVALEAPVDITEAPVVLDLAGIIVPQWAVVGTIDLLWVVVGIVLPITVAAAAACSP